MESDSGSATEHDAECTVAESCPYITSENNDELTMKTNSKNKEESSPTSELKDTVDDVIPKNYSHKENTASDHSKIDGNPVDFEQDKSLSVSCTTENIPVGSQDEFELNSLESKEAHQDLNEDFISKCDEIDCLETLHESVNDHSENSSDCFETSNYKDICDTTKSYLESCSVKKSDLSDTVVDLNGSSMPDNSFQSFASVLKVQNKTLQQNCVDKSLSKCSNRIEHPETVQSDDKSKSDDIPSGIEKQSTDTNLFTQQTLLLDAQPKNISTLKSLSGTNVFGEAKLLEDQRDFEKVVEIVPSSLNSHSVMSGKGSISLFSLSDMQSTNEQVLVDLTNESSQEKQSDAVNDILQNEYENTGFPDAFKGYVTVGKYISVKGDFTLKSSEALIESPSLIAPFLLKQPDVFPLREREEDEETKSYFRTSVGEFLISLGYSRAKEWCHRDTILRKTKQMKKEGKTSQLDQEFQKHQDGYLRAKKANEPFVFPLKACNICNFVTESSTVLEGHLLIPHVTQRREYLCSFCTYLHRCPKEMIAHMKIEHGKTGVIQPPIFTYECPFCIFETNFSRKMNSHLGRCLKYYDQGVNQVPPKDFDFPCLTPKPITVAVVKQYEKSLNSPPKSRIKPKRYESIVEAFNSNQMPSNSLIPNQGQYRSFSGMPLAESLSSQNQAYAISSNNLCRTMYPNATGALYSSLPSLTTSNRLFQVNNGVQALSSTQFPYSSSIAGKKNSQLASFKDALELPPGLPQPPKLQGPYPVQFNKSFPSQNIPLQPASLVVCEICDGYIKDMEQLRTHMQLIHKVKIHPKMLVSRPPLNCQKCQWRFFTDQGLERHLLGAHGLVTSNMQELANKGKDSGCCTICGRVYASKLVSHMNQIHKISLKPAHLSYKCTVCSATFNLYRLFENHVYLVHGGASKRPLGNSEDLSSSKKIANVSNLNFTAQSKNKSEKENGAS